MSKKDNRTLEKLFSHPLSMNLEWNEVRHMLESLGAEIETTPHNHVKIKLKDQAKTFRTFNHKMLGDKNEILELQHLLKDAGLAPGA